VDPEGGDRGGEGGAVEQDRQDDDEHEIGVDPVVRQARHPGQGDADEEQRDRVGDAGAAGPGAHEGRHDDQGDDAGNRCDHPVILPVGVIDLHLVAGVGAYDRR
jgi:hypothetical protein